MKASNDRVALFVANRGFCLATDCELIFEHFRRHGWRLVLATADDDWSRGLVADDVVLEPVKFNRGGPSPRRDLGALRRLISIHRHYRPTLVQHFNAKPILLDVLAASLVHRPRMVNTITGLGHVFIEGGLARPMAIIGYKFLGARADCSIFLNPDDMELFNSNNWIPVDRSELIVSPGVDCNAYLPRPPETGNVPKVLLATRLLWQKGVREYVTAAETIFESDLQVDLQLAGDYDFVHPDAVDPPFVDEACAQGYVDYVGFISDMRRKMQETSVFVLPSYREGVPRVLLEAMASGVPVVTTDVPGCRAAVRHGKTGLLVPARDPDALAQAIMRLAGDSDLRAKMGREARRWCVEQFDIGVVNRAMVDVYRRIGIDIPPLVPRKVTA